ncbi:MAG: 5'-deoxynucleotidase [Oscillospiraceae bacterium]|nr:5'-deoxynucleotidase [Oscillospiraceae bacterium]
MKKRNHFFAYMSRMRFIQRWALMRNTFAENVQEHSHTVAILAHALAVIRNRYYGGNVDEGQVAVAALYHDAPEILTGDMPTPIKYHNPAIRDAYRQVERVAEEKLLGMLPEDLRPGYRAALSPAATDVQELVRAADKLSAYIKCVEELKAGNDEFKKAAQQTMDAMVDMELPELEYFMEHFLPSYRLTLDELE